MIEQASVQAFGCAGRFFDMPPHEAVPTLAVAFHRNTAEGSASCSLPLCSVDLLHHNNRLQPKAKTSDASKASRAYMFGERD